MHYYYVLAQTGSLQHRCYVQLDRASADLLHDSLLERYDLVQVCAVTRDQVDDSMLIPVAP